jgi:hypothetical protein
MGDLKIWIMNEIKTSVFMRKTQVPNEMIGEDGKGKENWEENLSDLYRFFD